MYIKKLFTNHINKKLRGDSFHAPMIRVSQFDGMTSWKIIQFGWNFHSAAHHGTFSNYVKWSLITLFQSKTYIASQTIEKLTKKSKMIIFRHKFMKNSPIFFKFSQELYYTMLKQIPVTVCHKSGWIHNQKSKWQSFEYRQKTLL